MKRIKISDYRWETSFDTIQERDDYIKLNYSDDGVFTMHKVRYEPRPELPGDTDLLCWFGIILVIFYILFC